MSEDKGSVSLIRCPACVYHDDCDGVNKPKECIKSCEICDDMPLLDEDAFESAFGAWRYDTDETMCDRDAALRNAIRFYLSEATTPKPVMGGDMCKKHPRYSTYPFCPDCRNEEERLRPEQPVGIPPHETMESFYRSVWWRGHHMGSRGYDASHVNEDWKAYKEVLELLPPPKRESVSLDYYDAGLLGDGGGGDVSWWQDYIRAELGRAHDFYQSQLNQIEGQQP